MKYRAVYAGDTGGDYGLFDGGTYATVEEAVQAVKEGLESCYCHAAFGYVADNNGTIIVILDGCGEVVSRRG